MRLTLPSAILAIAFGLLLPLTGPAHAASQQKVDAAVQSALDWLVRHQSDDGSWSSCYFKGWKENKNRETVAGIDHQVGYYGHDIGVTGLALLAFLASGHTHKSETEHSGVVTKALEWLLKQQSTKEGAPELGRFEVPIDHKAAGSRPKAEGTGYDHAIATRVVCELLLATQDKEKLGEPCERAIDYCLRAQAKPNPKDDRGWRYHYRSARTDTSVTAWMCQALGAAKRCAEAGLIAWDEARWERSKKGALRFLDEVIHKDLKTSGYRSPGDPGSSLLKGWETRRYPFTKKQHTMSAANAVARLALGQTKSNRRVRDLLKVVNFELPEWIPYQEGREPKQPAPPPGAKRPPQKKPQKPKKPKTVKRKGKWLYDQSKTNFYYWYYGTTAAATSGTGWSKWKSALHKAVLGKQRKDGVEKGSWDNVGEWSAAGGRVYNTAILAYTLQLQMASTKKGSKKR